MERQEFATIAVVGSPSIRMAGRDWWKVGKGLLIAFGGAGLAYVSQEILPMLDGTSLGFLAPIGAVLVNLALKFFTNTQQREAV